MRLIDSCITQLKAQGPSRTCNEIKEEEEEGTWVLESGEDVDGAVDEDRVRSRIRVLRRTLRWAIA